MVNTIPTAEIGFISFMSLKFDMEKCFLCLDFLFSFFSLENETCTYFMVLSEYIFFTYVIIS